MVETEKPDYLDDRYDEEQDVESRLTEDEDKPFLEAVWENGGSAKKTVIVTHTGLDPGDEFHYRFRKLNAQTDTFSQSEKLIRKEYTDSPKNLEDMKVAVLTDYAKDLIQQGNLIGNPQEPEGDSEVYSSMAADIEELREENEELKRELNKARQRNRDLKQENEELRDTVSQLESVVETQQQWIEWFESTVENQDARIEQFESRVGELESLLVEEVDVDEEELP